MSAVRSDSSAPSAEDVVARLRAGDPRVFDDLYAQFEPRIFSYLLARLHGNREDAEDLTSEVFVRVYQKLGEYQSRGVPVAAWLFRIAHNCLVDWVRRRPRHAPLALEATPEIASGPVFGSIGQRLDREQIASGLARLTPQQRQVIVLRFLEDRSLAETAAIAGRNQDAVKKLQARGLAALRRGSPCVSGCWRLDLEPSA